MRSFVAGCWLLGTLACRGDAWIVAEELPSGEGVADNPRELPALVGIPGDCPSAADVLAQRERDHGAPSVDAEHLGRWLGTLDGAAASGFPSSALELQLDASGAGTLLFDAPLSSEPAREQGYLCSAGATGVVCGTASGFVGGFAYAIAGARSRDGVLSFVLPDADPWGGWCGLQASVESADPSQACGFSFGVRPPAEPRWSPAGCTLTRDQEVEDIDCALLYALQHCECARDACFAKFDGGVQVGLALTEDGSALRGSLWYQNEVDAAQVRLSPVP